MVGRSGQVVRRVRTPEGSIAIEEWGALEAIRTVVFLHGLSANRSSWRPVARRLDGLARCLLVDLLGRGESDAAPSARYDLESEVRRLRFALTALGIHRPLLAGHSHGAAIAVAASSAVDASGLLLVNPVTPDLERPAVLSALRLPGARFVAAPLLRLFRRPLTRYILVRRVFQNAASMLPGTVDRYSEPWNSYGRAAGLPRILSDWNPAELERYARAPDVPVHLIAGSRDRRIPVSSARNWADRLGGVFHLEAGCGHAAPEERTEAVASVLEAMLGIAGPQNGEPNP